MFFAVLVNLSICGVFWCRHSWIRHVRTTSSYVDEIVVNKVYIVFTRRGKCMYLNVVLFRKLNFLKSLKSYVRKHTISLKYWKQKMSEITLYVTRICFSEWVLHEPFIVWCPYKFLDIFCRVFELVKYVFSVYHLWWLSISNAARKGSGIQTKLLCTSYLAYLHRLGELL